MSFLRAEWRKLIMVNYVVDPDLLEPYVPFGTQLSFFEGKCYLSLVGFQFLNTRVRGVKIPFHTNFDEINLRFYVDRIENGTNKHGVVFIKEIAPKWAISFVANTLYKENYETLPVKSNIQLNNELYVSYGWKKKNWHTISVVADPTPLQIQPNSIEDFITEHYWGYAEINASSSTEYEVTHPQWTTYRVNDWNVTVDFAETYGNEFSILNKIEPASILLAEGSEITVENKKRITS